MRNDLDYRVRRRAELRRKLGDAQISHHVSQVHRAERVKRAALHLRLSVLAARHTASISGIEPLLFENKDRALAIYKFEARRAVDEMIEARNAG